MFKVVYNNRIGAHTVRDVKKANVYLHSDGAVFDTPEFWPTYELAQAVLDKYQPKHEWEHGDVFRYGKAVMIYMKAKYEKAHVFYLWHSHYENLHAACYVDYYLKNAKFLFNIKGKL